MKRMLFGYCLPALLPIGALLLPLAGYQRLGCYIALLVTVPWLLRRTAFKPFLPVVFVLNLGWLLVLTPLLMPFDPAALHPPGATHLMGQDTLGRDLYSRMLAAHRNSLFVAGMSGLLACLVGMLVGALLGFGPRRLQRLLATAIQAYLSIPIMVYFLLVLAFLPAGPNTLILLFGLTLWVELARLLQVRIVALRRADFVEAARLRGHSETGIFFKEIMPNLIGLVQIHFLMVLAASFVSESALSYLGLGREAGEPSLGAMVNYGIKNLESQPAVFLIAVAFFLLWLLSLRTISRTLADRGERLLVTVT